MPIYEFYCPNCNVMLNFFSRKIHAGKPPACPHCKRRNMTREISLFATPGRAEEKKESGDLPFDDAKMEKAVSALAGEAERINEDDPRQAAQLMRKFSDMTGMKLGPSMETAMQRMEAGEDPEQIESEMGDQIEAEEPFGMPDEQHGAKPVGKKKPAPRRDQTLYEM